MEKLDLTYLESVTDGDKDLMKDLIDIFKSQIPEFITEFKDAFAEKDADTLGRIAHKAKSSVAIMGLNDLASELSSFESEAGQGIFKNSFSTYITSFEKQCLEVEKLLNEVV